MSRFYQTSLPRFIEDTVYTPPWEFIQKRILLEDERVKDLISKTTELAGQGNIEHLNISADNELVQAIQAEYEDELKNIINNIQQYPTNTAQNEKAIHEFQRKWNTDRSSGRIFSVEDRKKSFDSWDKLWEGFEDQDARNLMREHLLNELNENAFNDPTYRFDGQGLVARPNLESQEHQAFLQRIREQITVDKDGRYMMNDKFITEENVQQVAIDTLLSDPKFDGYKKQSIQLGLRGFVDEDGQEIPILNEDGSLNEEHAFYSDINKVVNAIAFNQRTIAHDRFIGSGGGRSSRGSSKEVKEQELFPHKTLNVVPLNEVPDYDKDTKTQNYKYPVGTDERVAYERIKKAQSHAGKKMLKSMATKDVDALNFAVFVKDKYVYSNDKKNALIKKYIKEFHPNIENKKYENSRFYGKHLDNISPSLSNEYKNIYAKFEDVVEIKNKAIDEWYDFQGKYGTPLNMIQLDDERSKFNAIENLTKTRNDFVFSPVNGDDREFHVGGSKDVDKILKNLDHNKTIYYGGANANGIQTFLFTSDGKDYYAYQQLNSKNKNVVHFDAVLALNDNHELKNYFALLEQETLHALYKSGLKDIDEQDSFFSINMPLFNENIQLSYYPNGASEPLNHFFVKDKGREIAFESLEDIINYYYSEYEQKQEKLHEIINE